MEHFKTRTEFANELGLSIRTFDRRLIALEITLPKGLISPKDQLMIRKALGFTDE